MKKYIAILLVLLIVVPMFVACKNDVVQTTEPSAEPGVKLWYAYNTENYMQDIEYPEQIAERDSTLRMHSVRNDAEPIQLMITPEYDIGSYDMTVGDLTSANGDIFESQNFELFAVWYIEVTESYNTSAYYGFYPDALVPFQNYKRARYNSIRAGKNQSIWVQANIPADQAAGFYTGTATLKLDDQQYEIPVELTVYNAEIPVENHTPSAYAIWYDQIEPGEGYYSEELAMAYFDFLVEHRTMPLEPSPAIRSDLVSYVEWLVENLVENPAISSYSLTYDTERYDLGTIISRQGVMDLLTLMAKKNIELREAGNDDIDLFKKAYYYLGRVIDEPTGSTLQRVRDCDLIISECKIEVANNYFKDKYPDLYESCMSLRHVVTTAYNTELLGSDTVGGVQTWCPQYQFWNTQEQREDYYARRETTDRLYGEDAWWYGCNNPKVPFPTFHLDDDLISSRVLFWMQHDYHVGGDLYWAINCIVNNNAGSGDPWYIPRVIESVQEGRLVYPGDKFGVFGPISTLRMESIFQGREDYECLWQIEQAILDYNENNGTDYNPDVLMDYLYDDLYNDNVVPIRDNAEVFMRQRIQLLTLLEQFNEDAEAAIAMMVNK